MTIMTAVNSLADYGIRNSLLKQEDRRYTVNLLLELLKIECLTSQESIEAPLEDILACMLDYAVSGGIIEDSPVFRDLFDTRIMNCLMPRPSEVITEFRKKYAVSPEAATDYYYHLSRSSDYIRTYRVKNDMKWLASTPYGDIDITINLSKPEKDPKAIALAAKKAKSSYPKCLLCKENEGYAGRIDHPARENHRIIPLKINGQDWFMQYSPYVYYNEHCIVFNSEHIPMKIDRSAFEKLLDFVSQFPHYFIGSNADLPIVGGSILSHEHFQGGRYEFAMAKAPIETPVEFKNYPDVKAGIVKWPMSVIRISSADSGRLAALADDILTSWRAYTDEDAFIFCETDGIQHNTITPIARMRNGEFELDLVLRNNITTDDYPFGVYHPHPEYHNIKKENIGLIEVMGLAVLPARLKEEMNILAECILNGTDVSSVESVEKHKDWAEQIKKKHSDISAQNIHCILQQEIGEVFYSILEQCGVYKRTQAGRQSFLKFIDSVKSGK